jgi:hypothetical protein
MPSIAKTIAYDFKQVEDDMYINPTTGDFDFCPSDGQHVKDILFSQPGWYKEFPLLGCSIQTMLKGKINQQKVEALIKQQLEADGYSVRRPAITINTSGKFRIVPNAVRINL